MARTKQYAQRKTQGGKAPRREFQEALTIDCKRTFKYRPGTVALREIKKYQKSTETLIPKLPFQKLVKEIATELKPGIRFQSMAVYALQIAAEQEIVKHFEDMNLMAIHAKRQTVKIEDMNMAKLMEERNNNKVA